MNKSNKPVNYAGSLFIIKKEVIIILEDKLNEIMLDNNISFLVFTNLYDNTIEIIGNKNELKYINLIENIFGSIEHINMLNDSLKFFLTKLN